MRFAYIDSQGNEVAIPSVDALALRIELGAIVPDTELYDEQSDRWGPAHSHEIFHTLSRDTSGEDFPLPAVPDAPDTASSAPTSDPSSTSGDLGLTLTPPPADEGDAPGAGHQAARDEAPDHESFDLTAGEDWPSGGVAAEDADGDPAVDADDEEFQLDLDVPDPAGLGVDDGGSDSLDLDSPFDFGAVGTDDLTEGLDLESPLAEFDPSAPPAWMEQEGPGDAGGAVPGETPLDFSGPVDDDPPPPRRPAGPPSRGTTRRPIKRRRSLAPLLPVLLLGAVAVAGWYGWRAFAARTLPPPPRPAVVIPAIPEELEGPMRSLAADALGVMYGEIQERAFDEDAPPDPGEEWLAGIYLSNASTFPDVAEFWTGVRDFADRLGEEEVGAFHEAYVQQADSSTLEPESVALVVERADSGFLATRDARLERYALLGAIADASLALHDFLIVHEAEIVYTPARSFSGNPIEEAVPATTEVGDRMWDLVEEITNALDAFGTLDRVTRERLSEVLLERIRDIGIR